jgi:hypothetical protein
MIAAYSFTPSGAITPISTVFAQRTRWGVEANEKMIRHNNIVNERRFLRIMAHHHANSYDSLVVLFKRLIVEKRERKPIPLWISSREALATEYYMKLSATDANALRR